MLTPLLVWDIAVLMTAKRVIRPELIESTRAFVTDMLTRVMKQQADDATIDRVTEKVLQALPPSVRYAEG